MDAEQGRHPRPLSHACPLWRQSRRREGSLACLFRQGAAPSHPWRGRPPRRAPAIAGGPPAGPHAGGGKAGAQPRARPHRRPRAFQQRRDRARQGRAGAESAQGDAASGTARGGPGDGGLAQGARAAADHRWRPAKGTREPCPRPGAGARARSVGGHGGSRQRDRRGAGPRRLTRLFRRAPGGPGGPYASGAVARLGTQALHLRPRLRGRVHPSRHPHRGQADPLCRLCA